MKALLLVACAAMACGGSVGIDGDAGSDAAPVTACDVPDSGTVGSLSSGEFACGGPDNVYWTWSDDAGAHSCDEMPCPNGATCVVHSHVGTCQ